MKNIIRFLVAVSAAALMFSCGNEDPRVDPKLVSEWHLTAVSGMDDSSVPEVYISFAADGSFELYQKIGDGRFRKYLGTCSMSGNKLSGQYADGEAWGSDYEVSFDGGELLLKALNGSGEVCRYEKKALSATDKADADLVTRTHSESGFRFL